MIDWESDDEYFSKEKKARIVEISNDEEIPEELLDIDDEPTIMEPLVLEEDDDSNDLKDPVLKEGDSCDQGQAASDEKELEEPTVSQPNASDDAGEQDLAGNLSQPPNDPEANLKISNRKMSTDEEPKTVAEQPRKRKQKTKHICVPPAVKSQKKREPPKRKPRAAKVEKVEAGHPTCKIPGCFLLGLENLKQYSGRKFKQNKDELVQRIYSLFNRSVCDEQLPEKMDIVWNKKMLRTAGLCTTGQKQYPKKERFAKIQIAVKVCDSADRLRDTLIHEICHAASWLIDGIRDSHGDAWKYYAMKSNMVHPELPLVTRCHNYTINYRIQYECTQCKSRIGRYTKSLNTNLFICAQCKGTLVMLPLTRKDGTPTKSYVRPFAQYVQQNYRTVLYSNAGISHGDVIRKLSKDFMAKKQNKAP
ncbi:PREDICTED: acidic repeat-containing protein [Propithecus coquereli]|uniref:acidic repeat-containing protein n=1 Tax=Propithecus coquereli TaxID=379532 RepID=UPI00063F3F86|nr:PREDICTED: acidic repeat-containing protein [Propithecus coquereli]